MTLEGKEQELAAREHAVRAKQDAASRSLKEEQAQVEEERAQLGRERARLAVDVELLAPRLAEMSNEQQRLEQARLLLQTIARLSKQTASACASWRHPHGVSHRKLVPRRQQRRNRR